MKDRIITHTNCHVLVLVRIDFPGPFACAAASFTSSRVALVHRFRPAMDAMSDEEDTPEKKQTEENDHLAVGRQKGLPIGWRSTLTVWPFSSLALWRTVFYGGRFRSTQCRQKNAAHERDEEQTETRRKLGQL